MDTKHPREERRVRVVYLEQAEVLSLLFRRKYEKGSGFYYPEPDQLPEDYQVHRVWYSPERGAFGFEITSKTFEPVRDCEVLPTHIVKFVMRIIKSIEPAGLLE